MLVVKIGLVVVVAEIIPLFLESLFWLDLLQRSYQNWGKSSMDYSTVINFETVKQKAYHRKEGTSQQSASCSVK